jgi:hypothetical protein
VRLNTYLAPECVLASATRGRETFSMKADIRAAQKSRACKRSPVLLRVQAAPACSHERFESPGLGLRTTCKARHARSLHVCCAVADVRKWTQGYDEASGASFDDEATADTFATHVSSAGVFQQVERSAHRASAAQPKPAQQSSHLLTA